MRVNYRIYSYFLESFYVEVLALVRVHIYAKSSILCGFFKNFSIIFFIIEYVWTIAIFLN